MAPFVANMSDQDMKDVAAYYASLPRVPSNNLDTKLPAPAIVVTGAPMRNIARQVTADQIARYYEAQP
jgi:hypothetical protein